jgi:hypothetical protein
MLLNQSGPFSVKAWSPTPMTYQWQKTPVGNANLADILAQGGRARRGSPTASATSGKLRKVPRRDHELGTPIKHPRPVDRQAEP